MRGPIAGMIGLVFVIVALGLLALGIKTDKSSVPPPISVETHSPIYMSAFFEATRVYGRAGCGDQQLAEMTARYSIETGLSAGLIAAHVATESTCNPMAVSNKGAIGLMQIVPKVHSKRFDFTKVNLLNPEQNMMVGTSIMAELVKKYGVRNALYHYYGTGQDDIGLGGSGYAERVLQLVGR